MANGHDELSSVLQDKYEKTEITGLAVTCRPRTSLYGLASHVG